MDFTEFEQLSSALRYKLYIDVSKDKDYLKSVIDKLLIKLPENAPTPIPTKSFASVTEPRQPESQVNQLTPQTVSLPPTSRPNHLFLPKLVHDIPYLILGDSIHTRLIPTDISKDTVIRAYGGATIERLCDKLVVSNKNDVRNISLNIGINNVLNSNGEADLPASISSYEKLLYLCIDRFKPARIYVNSVLPVFTYHSDKNSLVSHFNSLLKQMVGGFEVSDETVICYSDISSDATNKFFDTDGLHPNEDGVKYLVTRHRDVLSALSINTSKCDIKKKPFVPRANGVPNKQLFNSIMNKSYQEFCSKQQTYNYNPERKFQQY